MFGKRQVDWRKAGLLAAGWAALIAGGWCADQASAETKVLHSDGSGVTLTVLFEHPEVQVPEEGDGEYDQISVDGCGWIETLGLPQLPLRKVRVGIPFGAEPRVRVLSVEEGGSIGGLRILPVSAGHGRRDADGFGYIEPEIVPDPSVYGLDAFYPASGAEILETTTLRLQRIAEVGIYPVRWNPATGRAEWISAMTLEVSWTPGKESDLGIPAPEEPRWESVYRRTLVNYEDALPWRRSPAPVMPGAKARMGRTEEWKFEVPTTGLYRVDYGDLEGADSPIPFAEIGVYRKEYAAGGEMPYEERAVPVWAVDANHDGEFGESDALYFWALDFRDAFMVHDFEDRYADKNVYWVGRGEAGGRSMDDAAVWTGAGQDTLRSFPERLWHEKDLYPWLTPNVVDYDGLPPRSDVDWWYWTSRLASGGTIPFEVYDPDPDSIPRLTVRFQGYIAGPHDVSLTLINGATGSQTLDVQSFAGTSEYFYETGDQLPAGFLTEGTNYVQFGFAKAPFGAFLDWIVVRYARRLDARNDYLHFNTGDLREGTVRVDGFAGPDIRLVDVTDPWDPHRIALGAGAVVQSGSRYSLVFPESTLTRREYVAFTPSSAMRIASPAVERATDDPCWTREGDYLLITHEDFEAQCGRLASYRESQGLQAEIVPVGEIYDAFGGGIKNPLAIKRYLQWAFDHWALKPLFVVLVGDASDDHRGINPLSGPDFVPSIHVMWVDEPIPADNWYADLNDDYLLDLYIGRLPAGSVSEMNALVDKVIAYEQFQPTDTWRGRIVALSDDQCSTVGITYRCRAPQEELFEDASRYSLAAAGSSSGARLDTIGIYMSEYTGYAASTGWHALLCDSLNVPDPLGCMRTVVRDSLTPEIFRVLNEGVLMFQFQGHGHRKVMAHEYVVGDGQYFNGAYRYDFQRLTNSGKPFIMATFGCHFADFSQTAENDILEQESLVEKAVLMPSRGAIAGIGPVGYEEYRVARAYQKVLADVFFRSPPWVTAAGETTGTRWILGELGAEMVLMGGLGEPAYRWVLLGDPALRVDALPPGITATVDGEPVADGDFIKARVGTHTVHIRAVIGDEVAVDTSSVRVSIRQGSETTWLERGTDFVETVADTVSGGRVVIVEYEHPVRLETYDIVFEAQDRNGRSRTLTLKVGASFEPVFDGVRVFSGDYVSPRASVELGASLPRAVRAEDLAVKITGRGGDWMPPFTVHAVDGDSTRWDLAFDLDGRPDGSYILHLLVESTDLEVVRFMVEAKLQVRNLVNYPNPFAEGTEFVFQLTVPAEVELKIFTVSGKHLATFSTKGENGYNRIYWSGRDAEGDEVANGVYLYRITAKGGGEEVRSEIQKAVRMR